MGKARWGNEPARGVATQTNHDGFRPEHGHLHPLEALPLFCVTPFCSVDTKRQPRVPALRYKRGSGTEQTRIITLQDVGPSLLPNRLGSEKRLQIPSGVAQRPVPSARMVLDATPSHMPSPPSMDQCKPMQPIALHTHAHNHTHLVTPAPT